MTVSVKGAELFYSTRGSGPACLVLSGIGTKPYERLAPPQLADRLELVYVDLRGSGRSTGDPTDLTFDVLADDLEAIRRDLGVERIAVLGHSILGALAIEYGRRRAESVSHVIAVGTPPSGDMARFPRKRRNSSRNTRRRIESGYRETVWRSCLRAGPSSRPSCADADAFLRQALRRRAAVCGGGFQAGPPPARHGDAHTCLGRRGGIERAACADLHRSWTLRLHGSIRSLGGVAKRIPGATLHILERSGHQPFFEEPDRFAEILADSMTGER